MVKLILMIALLFVSGASMGQKAVNVAGRAIIDCRDMPAKAITSIKKPQTTSADNLDTADNISSFVNNKMVYHYFEVMQRDYDDTLFLYPAAVTACANYNSGDGDIGWRLPTQRELMLIWTLHNSLVKQNPNFVAYSDLTKYWSATNGSAVSGSHISLSFLRGTTAFDTAELTNRVRCIRDLTPPAK